LQLLTIIIIIIIIMKITASLTNRNDLQLHNFALFYRRARL